MFIGHYAPALALKAGYKNSNIGWLFLAVQFVDILFFPFDLLGIEHYKIEHGFAEGSHLHLVYYPYTHGLFSTLIWAGLFYFVWRFLFKRDRPVAWAMALAVLSHWFMDLLVHLPDLPLLFDDSPKLGLGLWKNAKWSFGLEAGLCFAALYYYLKRTKQVGSFVSKYGMILFVLFMVGIGFLNSFVLPAPTGKLALTVSALVFYFLFVLIAAWLDAKRSIS